MEKKTVIFLTSKYMPRPGGTGICVHFVAQELVKRDYVVNVICFDDGNGREETEIDGVHIVRVKTPIYMDNEPNYSRSHTVLLRVYSILSKLLNINKYPLRSRFLVKRYQKELGILLRSYPSSIVIPTFTPLEAVVAVLNTIKKYSLKSVYYSTDTLSNESGTSGIIPDRYRKKMGVAWEKKIFEAFDKLIIMECHKDHYSSLVFKPFFQKMVIANFPLLNSPTIQSTQSNKSDSNEKLIVYAGTLYRSLRNPIYCCSLLMKLIDITPMKAVFMGGGDCNDIMEKYEEESKGAIQYLGMQDHATVINYLQSADMLLSIGNKESPMMPSKVFEYISTGKPIIHVYTWEKDPCIEPLVKYGNALLIDENQGIELEKVVEFMNTCKIMSFDKVSKIFDNARPEYTADIIERV